VNRAPVLLAFSKESRTEISFIIWCVQSTVTVDLARQQAVSSRQEHL